MARNRKPLPPPEPPQPIVIEGVDCIKFRLKQVEGDLLRYVEGMKAEAIPACDFPSMINIQRLQSAAAEVMRLIIIRDELKALIGQ